MPRQRRVEEKGRLWVKLELMGSLLGWEGPRPLPLGQVLELRAELVERIAGVLSYIRYTVDSS